MSGLDRLRLVAGWAIVALWVGSIVVQFVVPEFNPNPSVHALMMVVAGALFGPTILGRGKKE